MSANFSRQPYLIYEHPLLGYADGVDWSEKTIKQAADIVGGGTPDTNDPDCWLPPEIPWATPSDITDCDGIFISATERCISEKGLRKTNLLPAQSILLTSRATIGDARLNTVPMAINQGFAALAPKQGCDPYYLVYLSQHLRATLFRLSAGTTFLEISRREVGKIRVKLPEPDEQHRIGQALLSADEAIQKTKAKLEATRRLKKALMQQLFTRGMPGRHHKFKQTKIGAIPSTWKVEKVRSLLLSAPSNGVSPQSRPEPPGVPILNVSCVRDGVCDPEWSTFVDADEDQMAQFSARKNDFFVLRGNGNRDYVATAGLMQDEPLPGSIYSDLLIRLEIDGSQILPKFLNYLWQTWAFRTRLQSKAQSGSGLWKIGQRTIAQELIACPDKDEQQEILALLESTDESVNGVKATLAALQRLKKSLLQNLLTGKVRVSMDA